MKARPCWSSAISRASLRPSSLISAGSPAAPWSNSSAVSPSLQLRHNHTRSRCRRTCSSGSALRAKRESELLSRFFAMLDLGPVLLQIEMRVVIAVVASVALALCERVGDQQAKRRREFGVFRLGKVLAGGAGAVVARIAE